MELFQPLMAWKYLFIIAAFAAGMETQLDSCDAALCIMFHKHGNEKWTAYLAVIGTWDICQIVS